MNRLTLYGMYEYDPTLFDNMIMPDKFNHDDLVNVLLEKCGDLYTYYQVPSRVKNNITIWSRRMYHQFDRMINAIYQDYDPLENYNRYENSTDTPRETITTTHSGTDERVIDTKLGSTTTTTNDKAAFDSGAYQAVNKDTATNSGGDTSTEDNTFGHVITEVNSGDHEYSLHAHGNIGTTTSAYMLREEMDIRTFDIYNKVAEIFEREFMVQVY